MDFFAQSRDVQIVISVLVFVIGLCIGSFVNVLIYRIPRKLNFVSGRSVCPSCSHTLGILDLVPVFSFLFLRGKCRYCQAKISWRYVLVEIMGALLALAVLWVYGLTWLALAGYLLLIGLLAIAWIDIDTMEIPNGLIIYLVFPAAALFFFMPNTDWLAHVIGLVCISVPMLILSLLFADSFGGGDIKLMAVCGFALGWQLTLVAFFIALMVGALQGIVLLARKKVTRKDRFAFGPALTVGIATSFIVGTHLLEWYMHLLV